MKSAYFSQLSGQFCKRTKKDVIQMKSKRSALKMIKTIFVSVVSLIFVLCLTLQIGYVVSQKNAYVWKPEYSKVDISECLNQETLSESDYELLYKQTGLTKIGIDRALQHGEEGKQKILDIQNEYFSDHKIKSEPFALWRSTDYIEEKVVGIYLEDGDILVTASTHLSCLKIGHAGLVVDGENNKVLQAAQYGSESCIGDIGDFTNRINFMVLRPKANETIKAQVVEYAENNLVGIPYDAFVGTSRKQKDIDKTQCAHLVWYAYHKFDYELLDKHTPIVFPYDLVNFDKVELVQVFGFDPDTLWNRIVY